MVHKYVLQTRGRPIEKNLNVSILSQAPTLQVERDPFSYCKLKVRIVNIWSLSQLSLVSQKVSQVSSGGQRI
jgi:hypothetical protein